MKDYRWNQTIGHGSYDRWLRSNEPPIGEGVAILQCHECGRHFRTDHKWCEVLCPICDPKDAAAEQRGQDEAALPVVDLRRQRRRD